MAAPGKGATAAALPNFDYSQVDGVKVESREPAKIDLFSPQDGKQHPRPLDGVDELLLSDGRIIYQCVHRPNGCGKTWDSPRSVMSHLKFHIGRAAVKRAEDHAAEMEALVAELQRQNVSLEGMKARRDDKIEQLKADLRKANTVAQKAVGDLVAAQKTASSNNAMSEQLDRTAYSQAVTILDKRADELMREIRELFTDVGGLLLQASPPSEELLIKARRYDELRSLLGE